jgi:hypothetical protein
MHLYCSADRPSEREADVDDGGERASLWSLVSSLVS